MRSNFPAYLEKLDALANGSDTSKQIESRSEKQAAIPHQQIHKLYCELDKLLASEPQKHDKDAAQTYLDSFFSIIKDGAKEAFLKEERNYYFLS